MAGKNEILLPLLAQVQLLPCIEGQDKNKKYALVSKGLSQPDGGYGYLVELLDRHQARLMAWLSVSGDIYSCHSILDKIPSYSPSLSLAREVDQPNTGSVLVPFDQVDNINSDTLEPANPEKTDSKKTSDMSSSDEVSHPRFLKVADVAYTDDSLWKISKACITLGNQIEQRTFELPLFMAVCFLGFVTVPKQNAQLLQPLAAVSSNGRSMNDVLESLLHGQYADAIDSFLYRVKYNDDINQNTGFECYAAYILKEAGATHVRDICTITPVQINRLFSTGLVWTAFDADALDYEQRSILLSVEAAINRLILICEYINTVDTNSEDSYSFERCAQIDWHVCLDITANISELFNATVADNALGSLFETTCQRSGEWDTRSRMAELCEHIQLPCRFYYAFDCNVDQGQMRVRIGAPIASMLPKQPYSFNKTRHEQADAVADVVPIAYMLRVVALTAAMGFGSNLRIKQVIVDCCLENTSGKPLASFSFNRLNFMTTTLHSYSLDELHADDFLDNVEQLIVCLNPQSYVINFGKNQTLLPITSLPNCLPTRWKKISQDTHELSASMQTLLRAHCVSDLDIFMDDDKDVLLSRIKEAMSDSITDINKQCEILEDCVAISDMLCADLKHPLFCSTIHARLFAGLCTRAKGVDYYDKLPDSAFLSRYYLSRCYLQQGRIDEAFNLALRCVELAPTSTDGYFLLLDVLRADQRWKDIIQVANHALKKEIGPHNICYLYYCMAYAFINLGIADCAIAAYRLACATPEIAREAKPKLDAVLNHVGLVSVPSMDECEKCLKAHNVSLGPDDCVLETLARVAICFCDSSDLCLSLYATAVLATVLHNDTMHAIASSMVADPFSFQEVNG